MKAILFATKKEADICIRANFSGMNSEQRHSMIEATGKAVTK